MNQQQNQSVREAAARLLTSRALSVQQLRDKLLEKKYAPDIVESAVLWMQEHSMLDDGAYAAMTVRQYQKKRVWYQANSTGIAAARYFSGRYGNRSPIF